MKIIIEEEIYCKSQLETNLEKIKELEEDHVRASKCLEPNKCDVLNSIFWYKHHLLMALAKFNELEADDYVLKRTEELSTKAHKIEDYDVDINVKDKVEK